MNRPAILARVGEDWFTVEEVAEKLKVSTFTVLRWLRKGRLRGYPLGGRGGWRISEADLRAFLEQLRGPDDADG